MTNPVTPNIGLNKIDRTSPSTTYFDLEKYIDQNADAVDRFAGESSEAIGALEKRLDTEERREVLLQPGLQIVNAERSAPFKLSGIKGRTLVNLLGRDGDFEYVNPWKAYSVKGTPTVFNNEITVIGSGETTNPQISRNLKAASVPKVGDKLFIRAIAKTKSACESLRAYLYISTPIGTRHGEIILSSPTVDKPYALYKSFTVTQHLVDNWGTTGFILVAQHTSAAAAKDTVAVYSQAALYVVATQDLGLTDDELAAKYTYVNSVQPVRNPYAIRYGENLLPSFYEWNIHAQAKASGPYTLSLASTATTQNTYINIPVMPNTDYVLSGVVTGGTSTTGGYITVGWVDATGTTFISWEGEIYTGGSPRKIHSPANAVYAQVVCTTTGVGNYEFANVMLSAGPTTKPFKPREDSMLALQTDLFADPLTGANADEVFEKDGQYFKLAKWKKVSLDGSITLGIAAHFAGFKVLQTDQYPHPLPRWINYSGVAVKHDGKVLKTATFGGAWAANGPDTMETAIDGRFYISVSNADSGWGDNYTPTVDEIKAYFMGWKMYDVNVDPTGGGVYNRNDGVGKWWCPIDRSTSGVQVLPTTKVPSVPSYQLVYQLAKPTVESIVSEGMLTFNEGDNQVEVRTGLVVRESAIPVVSGNGYYWINGRTTPSYPLKNRPSRILHIYKNNLHNVGWVNSPVDAGYYDTYGLVQTRIEIELFDPSASYSITYLMLDTSPIVPFIGSYAANEKAMLQELTDTVQQNATAVSVLMNKKVDKDAPGWITPTLLNGWTRGDNFAYQKMSNGMVIFRGNVGNGTLSSTIPLLTLPVGYRPKQVLYFPVSARNGTGTTGYGMLRFLIHPDGTVTLFSQNDMTVATIVWLNNVAFLAEQ
ncbi:hypothetical protein [Paenibacillus sp. Y412MC10]|uniref:hypothetical protein n=1 Tax=Geobacillus sp. (strain Y412MC10) TaxID=481743 RepID=UPI0001788146|nr:hypothetical protein [Paenibacillus sp. Y412MC10]ACX67583.1 hypothetical protein GYMC10_5374 [Paenibacillus sp. Y412MC10]